jgi:hypothetical protein
LGSYFTITITIIGKRPRIRPNHKTERAVANPPASTQVLFSLQKPGRCLDEVFRPLQCGQVCGCELGCFPTHFAKDAKWMGHPVHSTFRSFHLPLIALSAKIHRRRDQGAAGMGSPVQFTVLVGPTVSRLRGGRGRGRRSWNGGYRQPNRSWPG